MWCISVGRLGLTDVSVFQVALEVIEELCYEMGLHTLEAIEEYAIFLVTNRGTHSQISI